MTPTFLSLDLVELRQSMSEHCVTVLSIPIIYPSPGKQLPAAGRSQAAEVGGNWMSTDPPPFPSCRGDTATLPLWFTTVLWFQDSFIAAHSLLLLLVAWHEWQDVKKKYDEGKRSLAQKFTVVRLFFPSINSFLCLGDRRLGFRMQGLRIQKVGMPLHMWRVFSSPSRSHSALWYWYHLIHHGPLQLKRIIKERPIKMQWFLSFLTPGPLGFSQELPRAGLPRSFPEKAPEQ